MPATTTLPDDEAEIISGNFERLPDLGRRKLQRVAKRLALRANLGTDKLRDAIEKTFETPFAQTKQTTSARFTGQGMCSGGGAARSPASSDSDNSVVAKAVNSSDIGSGSGTGSDAAASHRHRRGRRGAKCIKRMRKDRQRQRNQDYANSSDEEAAETGAGSQSDADITDADLAAHTDDDDDADADAESEPAPRVSKHRPKRAPRKRKAPAVRPQLSAGVSVCCVVELELNMPSEASMHVR